VSTTPTRATRPSTPILKSEPKLLQQGQVPTQDEIAKLLENSEPILLKEAEQISRLEYSLNKIVDKYINILESTLRKNLSPTKEKTDITVNYIEQLVSSFRKADAIFIKEKGKVLGLSIKFIEKMKSSEIINPYFKIYSDKIKTVKS
jgi:hypothetical protein